jgi:hypothetical protein
MLRPSTLVVNILALILVSCREDEHPVSVRSTSDCSSPPNERIAQVDRTQTEASHVATLSETEPENIGFSPAVPENASFQFYQRLSKNNYWDKGKTVSKETGMEILRLLTGAKAWSSTEYPQYVAAWGTHPYLPGSGAALDVSAAGMTTHYTFRSGCGLFDAKSDLLVIPTENREKLIQIFRNLADHGRVAFWR